MYFRKAEEFLRTFQTKGSIKTLNDVAKTVLCLDLSSNHLGRQFDKVNYNFQQLYLHKTYIRRLCL